MKATIIILTLLSITLLGKQRIERFALLVGANNGGKERVKLAFAHTDAKNIGKVLRELGGLSSSSKLTLLDPSIPEFKKTLVTLKNKIAIAKKTGRKTQLIFYYSGHSDEKGLLLGETQLPYSELKSDLVDLKSDVQIAILDSCASGAMIRQKGGKWRPSFLSDSSSMVSGHAILTSSSASEVAQESDRIGGSFFTHYMISGLRGAADRSNDRKVTLNEAYEYAFHKTLKRTQGTQSGAQHPNYDFQLAGSGDLVLTDLRSTSSLLILPKKLIGQVYIRDQKGDLIAQIDKLKQEVLRFGLEPGEYSIAWEYEKKLKVGRVKLMKKQQVTLNISALNKTDREKTVARGGAPIKLKTIPLSVSLIPGISMNSITTHPTLNYISYGILIDDGYATKGVSISHIGSIKNGWFEGVQLGGLFNILNDYLNGVQIAGIFNITNGSINGVQISGLFNVGKSDISGVQIAGLFNYAKGSVDGVQVGLINVADDSTFSIGLINIMRKGRFHLSGLLTDQYNGMLELKHGGSHWHMVYLAGTDLTDAEQLTFGIGLGIHIPLSTHFFTDIDLIDYSKIDTNKNITNNDWDQDLSKFRFQIGYTLSKNFALILGASLNVMIQPGDRPEPQGISPWQVKDGYNNKKNTAVYLWPSFTIGIQLF